MSINYFEHLSADFSTPGGVSQSTADRLVDDMRRIHQLREPTMPAIDASYTLKQIEKENQEWFPTHCNALREENFEMLDDEYRDEFVYLCADGPFHGKGTASVREENWVAIIAQPGATMNWPLVQFQDEVVYFEWLSLDNHTHEPIAKGNVTFLRRGHRGGIYLKTEQLTFFRDVCAAAELMQTVKI